MKIEESGMVKLFCACLQNEQYLERYAAAVGLPPFLALGHLALRILVFELVKNGNVVAVTPHRIAALVRLCGLERTAVRRVARAVKKLLRRYGVYPVYSNYVYRLADLARAINLFQ